MPWRPITKELDLFYCLVSPEVDQICSKIGSYTVLAVTLQHPKRYFFVKKIKEVLISLFPYFLWRTPNTNAEEVFTAGQPLIEENKMTLPTYHS